METVSAALTDRLEQTTELFESVRRSITEVDADGAAQLLASIRCLQRRLDGLVGCIARRATELASAGAGPGADQVLLGAGEITARQVRAERARSETVALFPALGAALVAGAVGADHVDAVGRAAVKLSERERATLAALDGELAVDAARLPPETFARRLRRRIDADIRRDGGMTSQAQQRAESRASWWQDAETGLGRLSAELDPMRWEAVTNAINHRMRVLATSADDATALDDHLAADALVELICGNGSDRASAAAPPTITVVVDATTLLSGYHADSVHETAAGHAVSREAIDRLACDAVIRRVTLDESGVPVNVGRRHRTATAGQWAALQTLYRTCGWWDCDRPIGWCQAHHVIEWTGQDGPTDLDNLVPLCPKHHHQVHEGGWRLRLEPDRKLQIMRPDGRRWRTAVPDRCGPHPRQHSARPEPVSGNIEPAMTPAMT